MFRQLILKKTFRLRADSLNSVYIDTVEARLNQILTKLDQV